MTVKLRLAVAALLLFLVVMVDFTSRIMSVLADGVLVCGIVVFAGGWGAGLRHCGI
uniref:DUF3927 family protein n=1 Tax=Escherichia coli TaxID=562 RepID=UPI0010F53B37